MACHTGSTVDVMSRNEAVCLIDGSSHALENKLLEIQRTALDGMKTQLNLIQHQVHDLLDQRLVKNEDLQVHKSLLDSVQTEVKTLREDQASDWINLENLKKETDAHLEALREKTEDNAAHCSELHHMFTYQETDNRPSFATQVCAAIGISTWSAVGIFTWLQYISKGLGVLAHEN